MFTMNMIGLPTKMAEFKESYYHYVQTLEAASRKATEEK